MNQKHLFLGWGLGICWLAASPAQALIVNTPTFEHHVLSVNIIPVADNGGANPAPLFGPSQGTILNTAVDQIIQQAGIAFDARIRPTTWNNTFALTGTPGANNPRPTSDLNAMMTAAAAAGVLDPDPLILNLFVTQIVPGQSQAATNTPVSYGFTSANGVATWTAPAVHTSTVGQEAIATSVARELVRNLGLTNLVEIQNLMQPPGSIGPGQRLNASQQATLRASPFSIVIGDTNLDRDCDFDDLLTLAQNYGASTTAGRAKGDFDRNGLTDFDDLLKLAQNYGYSDLLGAIEPTIAASFEADWALAQSLVPEPTALYGLTLAGAALTRRIRRPA